MSESTMRFGCTTKMIHTISTIDAHAAGEPLRLIVEGFPSPAGRTMLEKRAWLRKHADHLRRALMLEPRGHADMYGALLTEPVSEHADAGVLFMHNDGYSTMCGHGIIAVVTIALERGLMMKAEGGETVILDTPAGTIRATAVLRPRGEESRACVDQVSFVSVPSFVLRAGVPITIRAREVRVDVAFGGAFYAIVDSEALGLSLDPPSLGDLRRAGMEIKRAVDASIPVVHPSQPQLKGIYGTIFTGPAHDSQADLRNVTVFADAAVDRSPCGTATCAVMAVVDAMGLLAPDRPFVHESVIGSIFRGRVVGRTTVGDHPAILPEIEGSAWITGEHTFLIDEDDPLKEGFKL